MSYTLFRTILGCFMNSPLNYKEIAEIDFLDYLRRRSGLNLIFFHFWIKNICHKHKCSSWKQSFLYAQNTAFIFFKHYIFMYVFKEMTSIKECWLITIRSNKITVSKNIIGVHLIKNKFKVIKLLFLFNKKLLHLIFLIIFGISSFLLDC